jgi:hypothetical protein
MRQVHAAGTGMAEHPFKFQVGDHAGNPAVSIRVDALVRVKKRGTGCQNHGIHGFSAGVFGHGILEYPVHHPEHGIRIKGFDQVV